MYWTKVLDMTLVYSQNVVIYGFQQLIIVFWFVGRKLHAMQDVSLKLVASANKDHLTV